MMALFRISSFIHRLLSTSQIYGVSFLLVVTILFLLRTDLMFKLMAMNIGAVYGNKAIGDGRLSLLNREENYEISAKWFAQFGAAASVLPPQVSTERVAFLDAVSFLNNSEFFYLQVGEQLLVNPEFYQGPLGWIQYNSDWVMTEFEGIPSDSDVIMYDRSGAGHSTISQILNLASGHCYLLTSLGSVLRDDEISSFWHYWETYDAVGRPEGNYVSAELSNQKWMQRYGVFCLPFSSFDQKVTISPINVYGDAKVFLGNTRLYKLYGSSN